MGRNPFPDVYFIWLMESLPIIYEKVTTGRNTFWQRSDPLYWASDLLIQMKDLIWN